MKKFVLASVLSVSLLGGVASAGTITSLPQATFGGSGIPNNAVVVTTIQDGGVTITLGLTAHQRYDSPAVTNDGVNTFYAAPGYSSSGSPAGATWNFGFYVSVQGGSYNNYDFTLYFENDPATGNAPDQGRSINPLFGVIGLYGTYSNNTYQGTQNLNFSLFDGSNFDPNAEGEYQFSLVVRKNGNVLGSADMTVVVGDAPAAAVVPSPAAAGAGIALLAGMGAMRLRRRR